MAAQKTAKNFSGLLYFATPGSYWLTCSGRKVAIDASMSIYQFLIAVRQDGSTLTNADGETTRFVSTMLHICGIVDIFVLDYDYLQSVLHTRTTILWTF